jgi:hypothetical protein
MLGDPDRGHVGLPQLPWSADLDEVGPLAPLERARRWINLPASDQAASMIDSEFLAAMAAAKADRAREGFLQAIRRQLDTVGDRGRDVQEAIELAPVYGLDLLQMRLLLFLCHNTMTGMHGRIRYWPQIQFAETGDERYRVVPLGCRP